MIVKKNVPSIWNDFNTYRNICVYAYIIKFKTPIKYSIISAVEVRENLTQNAWYFNYSVFIVISLVAS